MIITVMNRCVLPGQTPSKGEQQHISALIENLNLGMYKQSIRPVLLVSVSGSIIIKCLQSLMALNIKTPCMFARNGATHLPCSIINMPLETEKV